MTIGFVPVNSYGSSANSGATMRVYVPATDSTAIYLYDLVTIAGNADSAEGVMTVQQSAATDTQILGSVVGFDQVDGIATGSINLGLNYRPASTAMYLIVNVDPHTIYKTTVNATCLTTYVGNNMNMTVGSGDTTTGVSGMALDVSSHTTSAGDLRLLGFLNDPNLNKSSATQVPSGTIALVQINDHAFKTTSGV